MLRLLLPQLSPSTTRLLQASLMGMSPNTWACHTRPRRKHLHLNDQTNKQLTKSTGLEVLDSDNPSLLVLTGFLLLRPRTVLLALNRSCLTLQTSMPICKASWRILVSMILQTLLMKTVSLVFVSLGLLLK